MLMEFTTRHFDFADLIQDAYDGSLSYEYSLDDDGVQAYVTADRVLVVPGTNEKSDWFKFNFKVGRGETRDWHSGFLDHARKVWSFAKDLDIRFATGHSLGAASLQIVGYSLPAIETVVFGAPKVLLKDQVADAHNVTIINRTDDLVCDVPPGFAHVGKVIDLSPKKRHWGEDHRIPNYIEIMREVD